MSDVFKSNVLKIVKYDASLLKLEDVDTQINKVLGNIIINIKKSIRKDTTLQDLFESANSLQNEQFFEHLNIYLTESKDGYKVKKLHRIFEVSINNTEYSKEFNELQKVIWDKKKRIYKIYAILGGRYIRRNEDGTFTLETCMRVDIFNKLMEILNIKEDQEKQPFKNVFETVLMDVKQLNKLIKPYLHLYENQMWNDTWYETFASPVCANGRLMQFTSTCWLNTIVNSLILPQPIRQKLIHKVNNLSEPEKDVLCSKKSLDECFESTMTSCPRQNGLTIEYYKKMILGFVYIIYINIRKKPKFTPCSTEDINKTSAEDIITKDIMNPYAAYIIKKAESRETQGFFPLQVLPSIMSAIFPNNEFVSVKLTNPKELKSSFQITHDIHLFYVHEQGLNGGIAAGFQKKYTIQNVTYQLMSCCILFDYDKKEGADNQEGAHAITGFLCDNTPYIYDANKRYPIKFNWIDPNFIHKFEHMYPYFSNVRNVRIDYVIYAKTSS